MRRYGTPAAWLTVVLFGLVANGIFIWLAYEIVIG